VFCERFEQGRIRPGLLQEGQERAMVGVFPAGLDALKVICCITMYG
jgi:hypothetical protein